MFVFICIFFVTLNGAEVSALGSAVPIFSSQHGILICLYSLLYSVLLLCSGKFCSCSVACNALGNLFFFFSLKGEEAKWPKK